MEKKIINRAKRTRILKSYSADESFCTNLESIQIPMHHPSDAPLIGHSHIKTTISKLIEEANLEADTFDIEDIEHSINFMLNTHLKSAKVPQRYRLTCRLALQYTVTAEDFEIAGIDN